MLLTTACFFIGGQDKASRLVNNCWPFQTEVQIKLINLVNMKAQGYIPENPNSL